MVVGSMPASRNSMICCWTWALCLPLPGIVFTASFPVKNSGVHPDGAQPAATDTVKVNYRGTLTDGKEFDSSAKNGGPVSFPLNRVIPCWTEGVQKMKVGGTALLTSASGR